MSKLRVAYGWTLSSVLVTNMVIWQNNIHTCIANVGKATNHISVGIKNIAYA